MDEIEEKNAIIESASLTTGERGLLTSYLTLDYGGAGQGFGGYVLYLPKTWTHHNPSDPFCGHWIFRIMELAGVDDWAKLKSKTIRVRASHCKVHAIGHIVKDDWFDPSVEFEQLKADA